MRVLKSRFFWLVQFQTNELGTCTPHRHRAGFKKENKEKGLWTKDKRSVKFLNDLKKVLIYWYIEYFIFRRFILNISYWIFQRWRKTNTYGTVFRCENPQSYRWQHGNERRKNSHDYRAYYVSIWPFCPVENVRVLSTTKSTQKTTTGTPLHVESLHGHIENMVMG